MDNANNRNFNQFRNNADLFERIFGFGDETTIIGKFIVNVEQPLSLNYHQQPNKLDLFFSYFGRFSEHHF